MPATISGLRPIVSDQQRVPGQHQPGLIRTTVVGDQVGMMRRRVPGRRDRLDLGVAELHDLAVGEWVVVELDAGAGRQEGPGVGALDQCRQAGDVVGLQVRVEDRHDRNALGLGQGDVIVDQVDVRVDHGELTVTDTAEQV
jgi:hypothetical protein